MSKQHHYDPNSVCDYYDDEDEEDDEQFEQGLATAFAGHSISEDVNVRRERYINDRSVHQQNPVQQRQQVRPQTEHNPFRSQQGYASTEHTYENLPTNFPTRPTSSMQLGQQRQQLRTEPVHGSQRRHVPLQQTEQRQLARRQTERYPQYDYTSAQHTHEDGRLRRPVSAVQLGQQRQPTQSGCELPIRHLIGILRRPNYGADYTTVPGDGLFHDKFFKKLDYPLGEVDTNGRRVSPVEWLRPWDIVGVTEPVFVDLDADRFDINQGVLGSCWFVAGLICFTLLPQHLKDRCMPPGQSFQCNYTGMFKFNFWHFGTWTEVVIDDFLPTVGRKLIYTSNTSQPYEFWVPLMEKAYAKLLGGYANLEDGGFPEDAVVDMTGGISQVIALGDEVTQDAQARLLSYLQQMMVVCSTVNCGTSSLRRDAKDTGIYPEHAYSVIDLKFVQLDNHPGVRRHRRHDFEKVMLICLQNPWGQTEWRGAWSDKSQEWNCVSDRQKRELGFIIKDDGSFWMSFEDFVAHFDRISICHLPSDPVTTTVAQEMLWQPWTNYMPIKDKFSSQPSYIVDTTGGTTAISLMQESMSSSDIICISLKIINASDGQIIAGQCSYQREVVIVLPTTSTIRYRIIPSASEPTDKCFLLRILTEN